MPPSPPQAPSTGVLFPPFPSCAATPPPPTAAAPAAASPPLAAAVLPASAAALSSPLLFMPPASHTAAVAPYTCAAAAASPPSHTATPPACVSNTTAAVWNGASAVSYSTTTSRECATAGTWPAKSLTAAVAYPCAAAAPPGHSATANDVAASTPSSAAAAISSSAAAASSINSTAAPFSVSPCTALSYPRRTLHTFLSTQTRKASVSSSPERQQEQGKQERPLCTTEQQQQQQQKYVQQQQQAYTQQQQEQKEGRSGYTQEELLSSFTRQLNLRPASSLLHLRRCAGVAAAPTAHAPAAAAAASPWSAATSWNSSLVTSAASSFAAPPSSAARPPAGAAATPLLSPPAAAATSFFSTGGALRTAPAAAAAAAAASAPSSSSGALCTAAPAGGKALCGAASVPRRVSAAAAASLPAYAGCGSLYCSPVPAGQATTRSREAKSFAAAADAAGFFGKAGVACGEQGDGRGAGAVTATDSVGDSEDAASSLASTRFLTSPASSVPASDSESPRSGVSVLAAATVGAAAATATARRRVVETPAEAFVGATGRPADSAEEKAPPLLLHSYSSPTGAAAAAGEAPTTHASLLLVSSPAAAAGAAAFHSKEGAGGRLRDTATAAAIRRVAEGTPRSRTSATTAAACCPAGTAAVRSSSAAAAATPPRARGGRIHSLGAARLQRTAAAQQTAAATVEAGAAEGEARAPEEAATRSVSCINGARVTPVDVRVRAAASQPSERSRAAEAAAGRGVGAGLRRREETATAYAPQGSGLTAAAATPEEEAAVQVTSIRWSPFQQRRSLSTTACSPVNSSSDRNSAKSGACAAAAANLANAACDTDTAADAEPPFAAAGATVLGVAAGSSTRPREDCPNTYEMAAVSPQDLNCMRQQLQLSKLQQQTQVQQQQRPTLQQQQHPLQQKQQVPTQQQQQEDLLQQQEATQQGQQEQRLLLLQQSTQEQQMQIQEQQQTLQRRQTDVNQVAKFFGWTESQGNSTGTTLRASSYSSTGSSCHSNASSSSGRDGRKGKARAVRACPKSLSTRHILTKPRVGKAPAVSCSKYRCSAGQGIQVPSVRVETTPLKLNNWSVSWQEVLCYNPRPYDITEEFKENYVAMRSEMERAITSIVDIVFVDRNFSHLYPPYIYHAYLIPPIRPHSPLTAASIQCHTSDDLWLRKGAWRRVRRRDAGGKIVEVLLPVNPEVTPFAPALTPEQQRQQRLQHVSQSNHPLYNQRHLSHQQHFRREAKLPLHLWLLLGGKDMQGLDGLVLAWKFLRFASEIPPSEFVEANESTTGGPRCGFKMKKDGAGELYGSLDWRGRLSGAELYKQYHQQGRNPAHDQLAGKGVSSSTGFSPFGPFLFDMKGVAETAQYRIAFLMVDIPGYGNSSGHPSPDTIRSCVLQSLKHALLELVEQHEEEAIVINVLGYSLGCAVAVALCADLAESIRNDLAAGLEVGSPAASSFSCGCCRDDVRFSVAATCVPARRSEGNSPSLCCCSCHSKIDTASQALEEQLKGIRLEQHADRSKPTLHAGVNFDAASNLTFKDTCNITMYEDGAGTPYVSRLKEEHVRHPAAVHELRGLRIAVNRLVLVAPFTSVQAMASRVAAATLGGGGLISRAAGALVSRQINWDNEASLRRLFSSMHDIEEQSQADVFRNFRLYIQHGECDTVIPWAMGYEVYRTAQSLKASFNLHHIPLQFVKMTGETHASILCGRGELTLLESCFCPYRLHPAAPLALLKFYSRQFLLPRLPGTFSVGPPLAFSQASTVRMRPCVPTEKSSNATNTKFTPSTGLSRTHSTQKLHSTASVISNKPHTKTSYSAYSAADAAAAPPVVEMLLCGGSRSSFGSSTCRDVHGGESGNGARVSCGETPPQAVSRRSQRASSLHRGGTYVAASTAQSELARFLTSALTRKAAVSDKPFSSATCATILPLATGVPMRG